LAQEIEKLKVFAGEGGAVTGEDVEALVSQSRGASIFALCDALGGRDLAGAMRTLRRLLELGEPSVKIVYMIHRHFRNLWMGRELVQGGGRVDRQTAAKTLGVPPFVAENVLRQARNWPEEALQGAFRMLLSSDLSLKSGGGTEVLDSLVLKLAGKKSSPGPRRVSTPSRARTS
jgi:DNA polymerase-3 subunit delta